MPGTELDNTVHSGSTSGCYLGKERRRRRQTSGDDSESLKGVATGRDETKSSVSKVFSPNRQAAGKRDEDDGDG